MTKCEINSVTAPADVPEPESRVGRGENPGWLRAGWAVLDTAGRIVRLNEALADWLGAAASSLAGRSAQELLSRRLAGCQAELARMLHDDAPFMRAELSVADSLSRQWYVLERVRRGRTAVLRLESVWPPWAELAETGLSQGRTNRDAEVPLVVRVLQAEAQLQNLLRHWPGVIFSQRPDFTFAFISPRIEEWTGVPVSQWQSQTGCFWRVVHEADAEALARRLREAAAAAGGLTSTFRFRHAQTGRVTYVWEHRQALRSRDGLLLGYEGIWMDTTRQTIAERRLATLAWRESLGMFTLGLTHDFTNLLSGILSLTESFLAQVGPEHPFFEGLSLIRRNTASASQLVRRIRQFHQGTAGEKVYLNLNEVVSEVAELLRKVIPRRIELQTELEPRPLVIHAEALDLRQVIVNLALNAVDAMPEGGRLTLRTGAVSPAADRAMPAGVRLSVQDTGTGIPACYRSSIFDPFFTTKPLTKGSGLGLYNARLFAEKHGGTITFDTQEGAGTTFHLWLPEADLTDTPRPSTPPPQRRHMLLVAGSAATAPDRLVTLLREHGYYVVAADSPARALEVLHRPEYPCSGVLVLVGPGESDWLSLLESIRRERIPVRTIVRVCGRNQDEMDSRTLALADLVSDPDAEDDLLLKRVRTLLDQTPAPRL